jgi:hypothetical protein
MTTTEAAIPTPAKKQRGCLFRALVTLLVLAVVVVVGGYAGYRYLVHRLIAGYTATTPLEIPDPALSPADLGQLDGRVAAFAQAVRNKRPAGPLVLTGDELTALAARSPQFRRLGGRARFSIGDGEILAELSIPLARMGYPDRWFNGSASFAVTLENGVLIATLRSASVRGEPLPERLVEHFRNRNLAKDVYENPQAAAMISRLESLEMANGTLTIVPRLR